MSEKEKPFAKDVFGNSIFMAESDRIKKSGSNVAALLELIAPFMGWKDGGRHVFVSDMSELGDFCLSDRHYELLSARVGFTVGPHDYIHEIAAKM